MGYDPFPSTFEDRDPVRVTRKQYYRWRKQARILAKRVTELQEELDEQRAANKALSVRCGAFMDAMDTVSAAVARARMDAVRKTARMDAVRKTAT